MADVGPVFVTETSALALTSVGTDEVFFPGVESGVVVVPAAVFVTVVPLTSVPPKARVRVSVGLVLGARVASEQVRVGPVVQVKIGPFVCDSETKVVPAGSTSVSVAEAAFEGRAFATTIV